MIEATKPTIAITATFTAELIKEPLTYWIQELGIQSNILFAPYNQVFQQLLDPSSLLSKNDDGINIVLIRMEDWQKDKDSSTAKIDTASGKYEETEHNVRDLIQTLKAASKRSGTPHIVCLCPYSLTVTENIDHSSFFKQMEELMASELNDTSSIYVVTTSELNATYPVSQYNDPFTNKIGHIPYTPAFFTSLATLIARKIFALMSKSYKVIVLDCDQTLWKGVCGEDGPGGVEIDFPYRALQEFMIAQYDAGMLLCVCSKNNEEDVFQVFDCHPRMLLERDHIVSWRINWKSKSENIKSFAEELQLGLDSFIFVDDNPIECAQVQAECPEVLTLRLPKELGDIPRFLDHVWAFDHLRVTREDTKRTEFYKQHTERSRFQEESLTFQDFLTGLRLKVHISKMASSQVPRIAQLTQRVNQFNFTTIRRSEAEIQKLYQSEEWECLAVEVSDRFGDYGLVGVIMFRTDSKTLEVDTFLLSCRALGRGVEYEMFRKLGEITTERGNSHIDIRYVRTGRNQPSLDFLNNIGAKFKYPHEGSFLFSFPAKFAESLTYEPISAESRASSEQYHSSKPYRNNTSNLSYKPALLSWIAAELYDTEKILERIRDRKLESQESQNLCYRIEQVLRKHAAVRQVVVLLKNNTPDQTRLVAYIVADHKSSPTISGHPRYLLPNGMAIVHQNRIETDMRFKEIFIDRTYLKQGIIINDGDCVFDVGANIGMFALFIHQVCKNTRIYAFEPVPQLYEMLCINTALYVPSAQLFNYGLSNENKKMTITFYPHVTGLSSYYPDAEINESVNRSILEQQAQRLIKGDVPNKYIDEMLERASITETFTTRLTTLSDILIQSKIGRINLLKIDVEKSELDVLNGINEQDWRRIDQIVMEVHSKDLLDKVMSVLKSKCYHIMVDQPALLKEIEYFMLYAIQEQSQKTALSEKEQISIRNSSLPASSTHLLSGKELRGFLKEEMPQLTMPLDVMFLDTLPMSANAEVNNQALPIPNQINCDLDTSSTEPLTFIQSALCKIWEEILVIDKVDLYDNFFDLGGHSLLATQFISKLYDTFKIELSMRDFFDKPTIAETTKTIEGYAIEHTKSQEILANLKELDSLSDNEITTLLAKEGGKL